MSSSMNERRNAFLALAWVSVFWGTTWLASRIGVAYMPALELVALRQLLGGAVFIIWFVFKVPLPTKNQWGTILLLSFLNFMISNGFAIWGMKYISSGLGAIIAAIFPLWVVVINMARGIKLPLKGVIGILLGFGGICIIFYDHLKDFLDSEFRFGIILSITASITWAFGTLYTKKKAADFNPYYSLGFQMCISGIIFLVASLWSGQWLSITKIPSAGWWSIIYLVIIGSAITFAAFVYALKHLPASLASLYAYINPVIAVLLGALVLDEKLNGYIALGGAVTIVGIFMVNESYRKRAVNSK